MKFTSSARLRRTLPVAALIIAEAWAVARPATASAQPAGGSARTGASGQDPQLVKQVEELRARVAQLQAALDQKNTVATHLGAPAVPPASGMAMPMGDDVGEMAATPAPAAMPMGEVGMGNMPPAGMPPTEMPPDGMMEMMGMPPMDKMMPGGKMMGEMGMGATKGGPAMPPAPAAAATAS